jgi:hypothetical protein
LRLDGSPGLKHQFGIQSPQMTQAARATSLVGFVDLAKVE